MKILLINPPLDNMLDTEVPSVVTQERGHNPPIGLLYVAASLEKANFDVKVIDAQAEELSYEGLKQRMKKLDPDVVGLSVTTFTLIDGLITARIAKQINPNVKVVFGGSHCHIYPIQTIEFDEVDFLILGEAEKPIVKLVKNINRSNKLKNVDNLIYKKDGKVKQNPWKGYEEDLDNLPFPARHLTNHKLYSSLLAKRSPVTTMITSRGCPYNCLFCNRPNMGKLFRARSPKNVVDEMVQCVDMGINEFLIYDDTFTIDRKRVMGIADEIRKRNLDIGWDIRARINTIDLAMLQKIKKAGCERIHYGVEAGNQKILNILRKGITIKQAERVFDITKKTKISTLAYFMIGNPKETHNTVMQTINFAKKLDPDYIHFSITTPFPATDLYTMALKEKIIKKDVWLEFATNPDKNFVPPLYEENINREELISYLRLAYKSFYTRPSYILKQVAKIRSGGEFKRKIKAGLKVLFS
ncbi:MAG: Ribosomal protein S12 methylthiotransferase RimO [Candidatus Woesearchaeota archaeon]|nr:Ribosomal protein S12 methylthiotransferase RimO [Candidatus Woesearchaeota archaeon]